ncbi:MAG: hypothetical protein K8R86_08345 [Bacteroidales bacterium]|nr:hypothetical protein [Bacteroidales bacterium]
MKIKYCLKCKTIIEGRVDKTFCSDYCRSAYNNNKRSEIKKTIREIDKILHGNLQILRQLNLSGKTKVSKSQLSKAGFYFNYFTNLYTAKNGNIYYFCYDYGYRYLNEKNEILVVKKEGYI